LSTLGLDRTPSVRPVGFEPHGAARPQNTEQGARPCQRQALINRRMSMTKRKRNQNEGSIFKRKDGRWVAMLNFGWENGKRKRKSFYGKTAAEVQEQLLRARSDRSPGLPVAVERQTVGQFLARWLEDSAKVSTRPPTHELYSQLVKLHIIPAIGSLRLEKVTPAHVQRIINQKLNSNLSPKTVRHIWGVLATALGRAAKWGLVARNAAALTDASKLVRAEIRALLPDEAPLFIEQ
jgi:Phage integrase, N-terminal SAM-like domain